MQEGSLSLMQLAKISSTSYDYQSKKKLFYVSILTSPTTGGVTASFGMLGDIIIAEPNTYIAFVGKRVIEQTLKKTVPDGSQAAEYLFHKGLFDPIVPRNPLKGLFISSYLWCRISWNVGSGYDRFDRKEGIMSRFYGISWKKSLYLPSFLSERYPINQNGDKRKWRILSTIRNSEELRRGAIEQLERARVRLRKVEIEADEYRTNGYSEIERERAFSIGMKDNSESALSTNKEAISNATMNLMESSILAQDER
ncbi:hypothetical protein M5K25_003840 [Dendrobium thyrsiflorum]|uniref:CoA carboxyltransferase N-terminal domain-containing protein n=1 Tax=Dendrobium thyrsiflorum TaxID=117978 RepID=A0ABD0VKA9_DENTH